MKRLTGKLGLTAIAGYMILAIVWSYIVPIRGGIDEPRHLRYVEIVATEHRLPTPAEKLEAISHQPPLHYLLATPAYWLGSALGEEATWRLQRAVSIVMGALALFLLWRILLRVLPDRPGVAGLGVLVVALLPHYLLVCVVVSNDATSIAASMLMLYFAALAVTSDGRLKWAALCGLAAGAACLTRHNTLAIVPAVVAALIIAPFVVKRTGDCVPPSTRALRSAAAFLLPFLMTAGVWLSNYVGTWGRLDSDPRWHPGQWPVHTFLGKLTWAIDGLYRSAWCQVGWLPGPHSPRPLGFSPIFPRPDLETATLALTVPLAIVALVGALVLLIRWLRSEDSRAQGLVLGMLMVAAFVTFAAVLRNAMYTNPGRFEGGRYLLPAVAGYVPLLAIGPLALPRGWRRGLWIGAVGVLILMNIISAWEMFTYLVPTFAQ